MSELRHIDHLGPLGVSITPPTPPTSPPAATGADEQARLSFKHPLQQEVKAMVLSPSKIDNGALRCNLHWPEKLRSK